MSCEIDSVDGESLFTFAYGPLTSGLWNGRFVSLQASDFSKCRVGGINGMNTTFKEALKHAEYISNYTPSKEIDWVYNRTHGVVLDGLEMLLFNYAGYSPNTAKQLQKNWTAFHEANIDNPDRKYLQICHSQGALHIRNALISSPKEIQDRIVVVAIGPAAIVPQQCCFKAFNYASEKDIIHYGEVAFAGFWDPEEFWTSPLVEQALSRREGLILLPAHPASIAPDHELRSLTVAEVMKEHIKDYFAKNGEYKKN